MTIPLVEVKVVVTVLGFGVLIPGHILQVLVHSVFMRGRDSQKPSLSIFSHLLSPCLSMHGAVGWKKHKIVCGFLTKRFHDAISIFFSQRDRDWRLCRRIIIVLVL